MVSWRKTSLIQGMAKWNCHELSKYNAPSMADMGTDKFSCWIMLLDKFSDYYKVAWFIFLLIHPSTHHCLLRWWEWKLWSNHFWYCWCFSSNYTYYTNTLKSTSKDKERKWNQNWYHQFSCLPQWITIANFLQTRNGRGLNWIKCVSPMRIQTSRSRQNFSD